MCPPSLYHDVVYLEPFIELVQVFIISHFCLAGLAGYLFSYTGRLVVESALCQSHKQSTSVNGYVIAARLYTGRRPLVVLRYGKVGCVGKVPIADSRRNLPSNANGV
jgi:hypothetical protein